SMPQESRGHYKIKYVTIADDASSLSAEDIMRRYYKLLEADIEAQPWNYLWTHNRWKRFPK
ncbi:MAG: acetyltransferase, partial [Bacteroidales bacterium]|nr:acetyltransferase [Bacteroidales bacterium]